MTSQLTENQSFPPGYRLDRTLASSDGYEAWVATSEATGDRVCVKVFMGAAHADQSRNDSAWRSLTEAVSKIRGMVHQNINPVRMTGESGEYRYLIEPYIAGSHAFSIHSDPIWPVLLKVIDALAYIHSLGMCHGNLHPNNIVLDDTGNVLLTGMGVPPLWSSNTQFKAFLSPQLATGNAYLETTDDIYALGCLIHSAVTGHTWEGREKSVTPLPTSIQLLVEKMTSTSAFDRNVPLDDVRTTLRAHFEADSSGIAAVDFSRASTDVPATTDTGPAPIMATRQTEGISGQTVGIGLVALILIAAALFLLLPTDAPEPPAESREVQISQPDIEASAVAATPPARPQIAPFEAARLEFMQSEGEKIARDILRQQLSLEDRGILLWGKEAFLGIEADLQVADDLFRGGSFEAALAAYEGVVDSLNALADMAPATLAEQIAVGDAALQAGEGDDALVAFTIATAIDSSDSELQAKLSRAENIDEVQSLMRQGEAFERDDQMTQALDRYRAAATLDPLWQPAGNSVDRVRKTMRQRRFQEAMSLAFQSINNKEYDAARDYFGKAQKILPGSSEPSDGMQQVAQAETNDAINLLRTAAEADMSKHAWQAAIDRFEEALAISPSLEFATQGLQAARWRLDLDQRIDRFLGDPPLLQSNDELSAASGTLRDAMNVKDPTDDHNRRVDSLAKLISTARIEVPVTIVSNGRTSVTVRKHAELGAVQSEVIYLIPGRYTITGERDGYRDVREELVIIAGRPVPAVTVASTERVR